MSTIKSSAENLTLNADGANNDIKFQSNGSEVASIDQAGVLVSAGGSTHADNVKAKFGTGNDLEIYHDGNHSVIKDSGTGNLKVLAANFSVNNAGDTENMIHAVPDGAVSLYHNNAKKIETTATGVTVTGGVALGGTGAANTLEDYEEGTWTPSFSNSLITDGSYVKIGSLVTCTAYIKTSTGGASGTSFSGLPFPSIATNGYRGSGVAGYQNTTAGVTWSILVGHGNTIFSFYLSNQTQQLPASDTVYVSLSYRTAS